MRCAHDVWLHDMHSVALHLFGGAGFFAIILFAQLLQSEI